MHVVSDIFISMISMIEIQIDGVG